MCVRGGEEHKHGGVEGLWAQRVSEWQTGWPFPTQRWQTLIRGNYKGPLARSDLILLRWWEPNVIMALGLAELGPSGNEPGSQAGTARLPTGVGVPGAWPKIFSENREPPVSCSVFAPPLAPTQNVHVGLAQSGIFPCWQHRRRKAALIVAIGFFVCTLLQGIPVNPTHKCFCSDNLDWFTSSQ